MKLVAVRPKAPDAAAPTRDAEERERARRFVTRVHRLRTLGMALGFFCAASVLALRDATPWLWAMLVATGFAWPHVARAIAMRRPDPVRAEFRNLLADSAFCGAWVAAMHFNLLPSVLLVSMLAFDMMSVGGPRLLLRGSAMFCACCLLTSAAFGFAVAIDTPMSVVVACVPLLLAFPLAISMVTFGLASKVARQNRQLIELSRTDDLTGLANRRRCLAMAEEQLARHRATGQPAALIVLDIDRFKGINDRYGHPRGDAVLRGVTSILRECSRATDTVARYAGDEFVVLLPGTDLGGAEDAARRIAERVRAATWEGVSDLQCTVSLGVAGAHADMVDVEDWIQQADAALYRAKSSGRDCVRVAPPVVETVAAAAPPRTARLRPL